MRKNFDTSNSNNAVEMRKNYDISSAESNVQMRKNYDTSSLELKVTISKTLDKYEKHLDFTERQLDIANQKLTAKVDSVKEKADPSIGIYGSNAISFKKLKDSSNIYNLILSVADAGASCVDIKISLIGLDSNNQMHYINRIANPFSYYTKIPMGATQDVELPVSEKYKFEILFVYLRGSYNTVDCSKSPFVLDEVGYYKINDKTCGPIRDNVISKSITDFINKSE